MRGRGGVRDLAAEPEAARGTILTVEFLLARISAVQSVLPLQGAL